MKRNCNGCKALEDFKGQLICKLNYKLKQIKFDEVYNIGAKPLEDCPKPKTNEKYLWLLKEV